MPATGPRIRTALAATAAICLSLAGPALAGEVVNITKSLPSVTVDTRSGPVEIRREQDPAHEVRGEWARTSRPCPDFCIQPMQPAPGVTTIGELELLEMLQDPEAVVVDSRTTDWFQGGTIPGAISIPYIYVIDELAQLGCAPDFDGWDCEEAKRVALFCNGIWCGQSPTAIRNMIEAGYPAERIFYYRGGLQVWRLLGLTVAGGD
ncbi:MAG: rhodanese-like domain-containing protein [Roseovarius sp.]